MTAVLTFELPAALIVNANKREHWAPRAARTRNLRALGHIAARGQKVGANRVDVLIEVGWPNKRRRDVGNLAPTFKALIDGAVVDGGLLPDDSDDFIASTKTIAGLSEKPGITTITITLTPEEGA